MSENRSTHLPAVAGGIETVTGTLVIDTGLREVQAIAHGLAQDAVATAASTSVTLAAAVGGRVKATLKVWKADGATAGDTAAKVSWIALGK